MDYNQLIDKILRDTKDGKLKWKNIKSIPDCIVLAPKKITKCFYTNINNDSNFYVTEYSYYSYSAERDETYEAYSIKCSLIQDNTEILSFDSSELDNPNVLKNLINVILKKLFDPCQQLTKFLNDK